jgi:hypothetical protein
LLTQKLKNLKIGMMMKMVNGSLLRLKTLNSKENGEQREFLTLNTKDHGSIHKSTTLTINMMTNSITTHKWEELELKYGK